MARRVLIVAYPGAQSLDVTGPLEVLATATQVAAARHPDRPALYATDVVAPSRGEVVCSSGLALVARSSLAAVRGPVDTLIVAGGAGSRSLADDEAAVRAIRALARRARRVASVCTGAFVLGAAGLLDGRRVTTHWAWCDALARRFPDVRVDPDPIFVNDGPIWTSAGVTAGIDLALALVEADAGRELALEVARYLVMFVRRAGGQSQFSAHLAAQAAERRPLRELQTWIADHPDAALRVPDLAGRARMSLRNFSRSFAREVGCTPAAYVERTRLELARRLLEESELSVEEVADRSGFGTPEALRRAFARRVGLSPREYRSRFRPALRASGT